MDYEFHLQELDTLTIKVPIKPLMAGNNPLTGAVPGPQNNTYNHHYQSSLCRHAGCRSDFGRNTVCRYRKSLHRTKYSRLVPTFDRRCCGDTPPPARSPGRLSP